MSEITEKKVFIESSIKTLKTSFKKKRAYNRKRAIWIHLSITILGALVAFLSGLKVECVDNNGLCFENYSKIIVLTLGIIITVLGTYQTFFNNSGLWISYTETLNDLKAIESEFKYYIKGKSNGDINLDDLDSFREKIQVIIDKTNKNWKQLRS